MKIELLNWLPECNGRLIRIECKLNQNFRSFYVLDSELIKVFVTGFSRDGITASNVLDFINNRDSKYKFEERHKLFFLKEFFTI